MRLPRKGHLGITNWLKSETQKAPEVRSSLMREAAEETAMRPVVSVGDREGMSGRPREESIWPSPESTCLMLLRVEDKEVSIGFGEWRSPVAWTRAVSADCWCGS